MSLRDVHDVVFANFSALCYVELLSGFPIRYVGKVQVFNVAKLHKAKVSRRGVGHGVDFSCNRIAVRTHQGHLGWSLVAWTSLEKKGTQLYRAREGHTDNPNSIDCGPTMSAALCMEDKEARHKDGLTAGRLHPTRGTRKHVESVGQDSEESRRQKGGKHHVFV